MNTDTRAIRECHIRLQTFSRNETVSIARLGNADEDADPTAGGQAVRCDELRLTRVRGGPLQSEALRFTEIVRRQLACSYVAILDGVLSVLTGRS
jgi:hypothetical protein